MKPPIHPLRRWLFDHQETLVEFSERARLSQSYLSEVLTGLKRPSLDWIDKVSAATAGDITALHFQQYSVNGEGAPPTRPADLDICPACPDPAICRARQRCARGEPLPAPTQENAA